MKRSLVGVGCGVVAGVIVLVAAGGCTDSRTMVEEAATSVSATADVSSTEPGSAAGSPAAAGFPELVSGMDPVPVFGLLELPTGVDLAGGWWPATEPDSQPDASNAEPNPHVSGGDGPEPEGQLLLTYGDGWLVVIENFRGDLGDVAGEPIGLVDGSAASLYELNGGLLVQWSHEGRWYGVFGRDVPEDVVRSVALDMTLL